MLWHKTTGEGPDLVLLHGWAFNGDIFQSLVEKFKHKYRITVIDLPGHGRSSDINGDIESWCSEIIKLIPQESILLGWSLGGLLSTYIASQIKVKELILVASSPCLVTHKNWSFGIENKAFEIFVSNLRNDSTQALKRFVSLQSKDKSQILELHQSIQKFPASQSALDIGLQIILNSDLRETYKNISTPKKCILGSLDTLVPVKIQGWYDAAGSKTHVLRSGHLPFLDSNFQI